MPRNAHNVGINRWDCLAAEARNSKELLAVSIVVLSSWTRQKHFILLKSSLDLCKGRFSGRLWGSGIPNTFYLLWITRCRAIIESCITTLASINTLYSNRYVMKGYSYQWNFADSTNDVLIVRGRLWSTDYLRFTFADKTLFSVPPGRGGKFCEYFWITLILS